MRLLPQLAELALESPSLHSFHRSLVDIAPRALGVAGAAVVTMRTSGVGDIACDFDQPQSLGDALARLRDEVTPDEKARALASGSHRTDSLYSAKRQDELHIFREYFKSVGARASVVRVWLDAGAWHQIAFSAPRAASINGFTTRVCGLVDEVFPIVALAVKLLTPGCSSAAEESLPRALTLEFKLTRSEHDTIALVMRGLTNAEIAHVLGISANTVRNRLAVCFPKIGASRRAEAVFLLEEARRERRVVRDSRLVTFRSRFRDGPAQVWRTLSVAPYWPCAPSRSHSVRTHSVRPTPR